MSDTHNPDGEEASKMLLFHQEECVFYRTEAKGIHMEKAGSHSIPSLCW